MRAGGKREEKDSLSAAGPLWSWGLRPPAGSGRTAPRRAPLASRLVAVLQPPGTSTPLFLEDGRSYMVCLCLLISG
jgi:hypothetical protein